MLLALISIYVCLATVRALRHGREGQSQPISSRSDLEAPRTVCRRSTCSRSRRDFIKLEHVASITPLAAFLCVVRQSRCSATTIWRRAEIYRAQQCVCTFVRRQISRWYYLGCTTTSGLAFGIPPSETLRLKYMAIGH